jgi:hypothetical protein
VINSYFSDKSKESDECQDLTNADLCLVSILLATKFLIDEGEDEEIYNNEWAAAANISTKRINKLEKKVLNKLDWELYVSNEEFWRFTNELTKKCTYKKVKLQLNNCTYSDLDFILSYSASFESIVKSFTLLAKLMILCTSTLVYIFVSSYIASSFVLYVKNELTIRHLMQINPALETIKFSIGLNQSIEMTNSFAALSKEVEINHEIFFSESTQKLTATGFCPIHHMNKIKIKSDLSDSNLNELNEILGQKICDFNEKVSTFFQIKKLENFNNGYIYHQVPNNNFNFVIKSF